MQKKSQNSKQNRVQLTRGKVTLDEKLLYEYSLFGFKDVHVGQSWIAASSKAGAKQ